ncbi:hypothetical protein Hamer_G028996 [Homarus americanus]|uniref:Corticotropin-releasing factor domain-containing protein n=1 Tax=Homarus americanus TaxID=6706 RepID=A0A8J5JWX6_HOMAM|nr:hypothetical protein Hamer_G028996 [Homarus americanus]
MALPGGTSLHLALFLSFLITLPTAHLEDVDHSLYAHTENELRRNILINQLAIQELLRQVKEQKEVSTTCSHPGK